MCIVTAHAGAESLSKAVISWGGDRPVFICDGTEGMLPAYQHGYMAALQDGYDLIAFLHDDTIIDDPQWDVFVMEQFEDPEVGLVGFGGGSGHGDPHMYYKEYDYHLLARNDFMSNMVDAENHGRRIAGSERAAVLDGFAMVVRTCVLAHSKRGKFGGWPLDTPVGYVCYDYWLSCMTRRQGYSIKVVGVACEHLGGQTFVKLGIGRDPKHWEQYLASHRYIYDEFKDVLPFKVTK
jgi:Glycosyltransferase like family